MSKSTKWVTAAICAVGMAAGNVAASTVLLRDDFDAELIAESRTKLSQFVITRGSLDVMRPGKFGVKNQGRFLDLDGSTSRAARMESRQDFALSPGTYTLSFDVAGSLRDFAKNPNTMTVSLGDAFSTTISKRFNERFDSLAFDITVTQATSGRLVFDHTGSDHVGLLLDNVSLVNTTPAAAPTPPTTPTMPTAPPVVLPPTTPPVVTPPSGGPAVPIPLPAAAWTGVSTLGLLAAASGLRRRRSE